MADPYFPSQTNPISPLRRAESPPHPPLPRNAHAAGAASTPRGWWDDGMMILGPKKILGNDGKWWNMMKKWWNNWNFRVDSCWSSAIFDGFSDLFSMVSVLKGVSQKSRPKPPTVRGTFDFSSTFVHKITIDYMSLSISTKICNILIYFSNSDGWFRTSLKIWVTWDHFSMGKSLRISSTSAKGSKLALACSSRKPQIQVIQVALRNYGHRGNAPVYLLVTCFIAKQASTRISSKGANNALPIAKSSSNSQWKFTNHQSSAAIKVNCFIQSKYIKMKLLGKENKNGQIYSNVSNIVNVLQHQLYNSVWAWNHSGCDTVHHTIGT